MKKLKVGDIFKSGITYYEIVDIDVPGHSLVGFPLNLTSTAATQSIDLLKVDESWSNNRNR